MHCCSHDAWQKANNRTEIIRSWKTWENKLLKRKTKGTTSVEVIIGFGRYLKPRKVKLDGGCSEVLSSRFEQSCYLQNLWWCCWWWSCHVTRYGASRKRKARGSVPEYCFSWSLCFASWMWFVQKFRERVPSSTVDISEERFYPALSSLSWHGALRAVVSCDKANFMIRESYLLQPLSVTTDTLTHWFV